MDRETGKKAIEWIKQLNETGFFMAVGLKLPHLAWVAPKEFFEKHSENGSVLDNMYVPNNLPSAAFSDSGDLRRYADISVLLWSGQQNDKLDNQTRINSERHIMPAFLSLILWSQTLLKL